MTEQERNHGKFVGQREGLRTGRGPTPWSTVDSGGRQLRGSGIFERSGCQCVPIVGETNTRWSENLISWGPPVSMVVVVAPM